MKQDAKIKGAILLTGPGRSGTTLLANWLALHPEVSWISNYVNYFPRLPQLSILNRIQSIAWLERWNRKYKKWPRPYEAYSFWNSFFRDFNALENSEPGARNVEDAVNTIHSILRWQGKNRFLTKVTGTSRWGSLQQILDQPFIIWIERDPRAVVLSMMHLKWFFKDKSADFEKMNFNQKADFYVLYYKKVRQSRLQYPCNLMLEIKYEELIENKEATLKKIVLFANLKFDERWKKRIDTWHVKPVLSDAYKNRVSPEEWGYLSGLLSEELTELKYKL